MVSLPSLLDCSSTSVNSYCFLGKHLFKKIKERLILVQMHTFITGKRHYETHVHMQKFKESMLLPLAPL